MSNSEEGVVVGDQLTDCQRPKNVPLRLWEKFQALEKRTNEVTKRSTEKRIKHLQKTALENVARALQHPEDQALMPPALLVPGTPETDSKALGDDCAASHSTAPSRKRTAAHHLSAGDNQEEGARASKRRSPQADKEREGVGGEEREWQEVRGLLGVNDHLRGVSHGSLGPKTVLELRIDDAIAKGDYRTAEELSDHMSAREFGEKVANAIDAKNFLKHKQEEEELAKAKRKKKLHWGFEAKHRWETKSNM